MSPIASGSVGRQLGALFEGGSMAGLSDRQLLERFLDSGREPAGEAAFAAIVARHGPVVLDVCRDVLGDAQHAEDAFQAVFLVLARRAASVRDPDRLGNWLYGVALRTSRCARRQVVGRRRREEAGAMTDPPGAPPADRSAIDREQAEALHGEVERLPRAFRQAVVLCYFEGLTLDEAARRLRCPPGTLRSRLARARDKLRIGLARRGVVLPAAAMAAILSPRTASASIPPLLCPSTARAAIRFAARHGADGAPSTTAAAIAREVLRTMMFHRLRSAAMTVLMLGAVAAGLGPRAIEALGDPPQAEPPRQAPRPEDPPRPALGRMFIVGRVLAPDGRPVPGATVGIAMRRKLLFSGLGSEGGRAAPAGDGTSDATGRFQIDASRSSSAHQTMFGATAIAPGFGVGWADLDPDEDRPAADITLAPEQVIEGRLLDVQGRPVAGAVVSVSSVWRPLPPIALAQGVNLARSEGRSHWWGRVNDLPGWPRPATTDADGRFTLRGIGREMHASLIVLDPRFAPQGIDVATDAREGDRALEATLQPARTLTGRVTHADDGRPVAGAEVHVRTRIGRGGSLDLPTETDADGRFRIRPMLGDRLSVAASPTDGQPYRLVAKDVTWPAGATESSVDLALPRGILVRGKVTEEGTGRPVTDARVAFHPYRDRARQTEAGGYDMTKADGSFSFAVGPRPGHLAVQAPGEDYQLQVAGNTQFYQGGKGGLPVYAHAFSPIDPGKSSGPLELNFALRRGTTVEVRLIGPDGRPPSDVRVYSRAVLGPSSASVVRGWGLGTSPDEVARRGHFAVHGLAPDEKVPVHFLQPDRRLGATAWLSGKMAAQGPITVRLEPCVTALARLVGPDGRPVAGPTRGLNVTMVVTPGPPVGSPAVRDGALAADEAALARLDPVNHNNRMIADVQGRVEWAALIPGATYRVLDRSAVVARDVGDGPQVRREFTVRSGEAIDLGDILIEKPQ